MVSNTRLLSGIQTDSLNKLEIFFKKGIIQDQSLGLYPLANGQNPKNDQSLRYETHFATRRA
ncbi:MAG: hypothetical protein A2622_01995 [Bdellovibrionales bacterium RIFCSPHIGHO2_01_FULL_40_29]|nr:MAG: hypothetical protein A2622_01995 [Bdellovibrionales bacterium RIFCSPHIGHO2_01_FULL_40_29]OFZ33861.1 MAG: hypothetical protein A3D17_02415 [Bdellovibrionales bacterium RIFCSPHIGHO2_02_FULL_40_15]